MTETFRQKAVAEVDNVLVARFIANTQGTCPICKATNDPTGVHEHGILTMAMVHESFCPVGNEKRYTKLIQQHRIKLIDLAAYNPDWKAVVTGVLVDPSELSKER